MSQFSGKCDLCDHISGYGGWFDREGNPVKFGQEGVRCYYSDEMLDFLAFKKATNGILHQHKKITLTNYNHEDVKKLCSQFDYTEHIKVVPDKRQKSGQREEKYLTYTYYGKEYTLKELNKKGIWITIDIHFNTLLDLIPYYPYIVSMSCGGTVYISEQSYVDEERDNHLEHGWYSDFWQHYKKELQEHYKEVVLEYYNPTGRQVKEDLMVYEEDGKLVVKTTYAIDDAWDIKVDRTKHSWIYSSPKIISERLIDVSDIWPGELKSGENLSIEYVKYEAPKHKLS